MSAQYTAGTLPRPPFRIEGDSPDLVRMDFTPSASDRGLFSSSAIGHPAAASIARRACFTSASR
eukprot:scaffold4543_cov126-Isochrysis_galbana.AAC.16